LLPLRKRRRGWSCQGRRRWGTNEQPRVIPGDLSFKAQTANVWQFYW